MTIEQFRERMATDEPIAGGSDFLRAFNCLTINMKDMYLKIHSPR